MSAFYLHYVRLGEALQSVKLVCDEPCILVGGLSDLVVTPVIVPRPALDVADLSDSCTGYAVGLDGIAYTEPAPARKPLGAYFFPAVGWLLVATTSTSTPICVAGEF